MPRLDRSADFCKLLMPVTARRQLNDLPDDLWTRVKIEFYKDAPDAVFKALLD